MIAKDLCHRRPLILRDHEAAPCRRRSRGGAGPGWRRAWAAPGPGWRRGPGGGGARVAAGRLLLLSGLRGYGVAARRRYTVSAAATASGAVGNVAALACAAADRLAARAGSSS